MGGKAVKRLSGGNPQVAKAEGDAPVQAYIAAMPGWKSDLGRRLDALIAKNAPGVGKAVKWNSPFYGMEGQGWFLSFHVFTRYVKVTFFKGASLQPPPPGATDKAATPAGSTSMRMSFLTRPNSQTGSARQPPCPGGWQNKILPNAFVYWVMVTPHRLRPLALVCSSKAFRSATRFGSRSYRLVVSPGSSARL